MAEPSVLLVNYDIWHMRMGHPSKNVLKHVETNTNGFTPKLEFPNSNKICPGCIQGKMHNKPFTPSMKCGLKPFHLIHADLVELPILSYHKYKWACMLLDDHSSYAYCYLRGLYTPPRIPCGLLILWMSNFARLKSTGSPC